MRRRWITFILCLVQFIDVLGVTSVTTAIPPILDGLGAPESAAAPLATVYAMFFGGLLVLGSRLGDRYGHRRVLVAGVLVFTFVSMVGAASAEIGQVLAARSLQGAAAALSVPSALRMLLHASPDQRHRRTALALWSASGAAAGASGFVVGGVLAQVWGWPAVFWVNVPVGILLIGGILVFVPVLPAESRDQRLDIIGAILLITSTMSIVAGSAVMESVSMRLIGVGIIALGLVIGTGFFARQRKAADPLIPIEAMGSPNLRAGTVVSFINTATTSSTMVLATLLLQNHLGATPLQAGLLLISFSLAVIVGSSLSKPLAEKLSAPRLAAVGLLIIAGGSLLLAATYGTWWGIAVGAAVSGTGIGISSVAGTTIGTTVPERLEGSASGVLNTGAQLGTAIGVAALVLLASTITLGSIPGTAIAWLLAAALAAATAIWVSRTSTRPGDTNLLHEQAREKHR